MALIELGVIIHFRIQIILSHNSNIKINKPEWKNPVSYITKNQDEANELWTKIIDLFHCGINTEQGFSDNWLE